MTTAATTGFAIDKLETNGFTFYFDGNQKTAGFNGTFENPKANSFSLVQIEDCPFSTPTCRSTCYVHNLEEHQEAIHQKYKHNSMVIRDFLDQEDYFNYLDVVNDFSDWIRKNSSKGFRWHTSGDIYSYEYAQFIQDVVDHSYDVNHWIYTRSFHLLKPILGLENLVVNLSADKDNYWLARRYADKYGLRVCYLTVDGEVPPDMKEGDVIFPDYSLRGVDMKPHAFREGSEWWKSLKGKEKKMVCPVDIYGKSDKVRCGPCSKCLV